MCNPKVDELSMMTYLSQFPHCKLKPGAPLRPKTNPARVRAYGPGMFGIESINSSKYSIVPDEPEHKQHDLTASADVVFDRMNLC